MQESKRKLFVMKPGTSEFVPIEVTPSEHVQDVLRAIGAGGALGLSTGPRHGLAPATLWNWVADGQTLSVVRSNNP